MPDEDELEVELEDGETPAGGGEGGEGGEPGAQPTAAEAKLAGLEAEVERLRAMGGNSSAQMAELINIGKSFLATQAKPGEDPAEQANKIAAYGKKLKDLVLTGDDADIAKFFIGSVEDVAQRKVDAALSKYGNPLADKAGQYAVQMFLDTKAADTPEKVHKLVAKNFMISETERQSLATATPAETKEYLDAKYERAAGKVLLGSASRIAAPRSMGGGGGGGGGGNVVSFPGMNAAESQRLIDWTTELYPGDPAKQKKSIEATIKRMQAEAS
jgi:hypothetical protein